MDALQFFLLRYDRVYRLVEEYFLDCLSDDQLRRAPIAGMNTIAWLTWHTTRVEDVGVNRFVAHQPQLFHEQCWAERLNVPDTDIGAGMTAAEVVDLSRKVDLAALRAYRAAVEDNTRSAIAALRPADLDDIVDAAYIRWFVDADGVLRDAAGWVRDLWDSNTKGHYLAYLALTHHWQHEGEALTIRHLLGIPGR
jgi:hypothetical protein